MTRAVYYLGEPGTGKTTLMARRLAGWTVGPYIRFTPKEMFGHYLSHPEQGYGAYLGHLRPEYPGTDALSMSVAPHAMLWLQSLPLLGLDWVFGEGQRIGHPGFLTALDALTDLTVVHLQVSPEVAAARRAGRGGSKLITERHCKLIRTKALKSATACAEAGLRVVGTDPEL